MTRVLAALVGVSIALGCGGDEPSSDSTPADSVIDTTAAIDSADLFRDAPADTQLVTDSLGNELLIITQGGRPPVREVDPRKGAGDPDAPDAFELVPPAEARQAMEEAPVAWYVLDVRSGRQYVERGHLPGATLVPLERLEENVEDLHVRTDAPILVVAEDDLASRRAARVLVEYGFPDVRVLQGGLEAWREAGLPLETR